MSLSLRTRLSTSARLTLANSALLAVAFGALLLLIGVLADRFMVGHVQESVQAELSILQAELSVDGRSGMMALIRQRISDPTPNHDRLYLLEDPDGTRAVGNLDRWPQAAGAGAAAFRLPSRKYPGRTEVVAQWARLSDGSRLLVGFDEIEIAQVRGDIRRAALWALAAMLLVSLTAGFLLTRAALRPVEAIRKAAQRIMEGDLQHRIPGRPTTAGQGGDEFDRLSATLNAMLDRINVLIESVRGATDNIAHDLRSPLTRHRARLEAALHDRPDAERTAGLLESSIEDLDQVLSTFQSLLRIASVESGLLRQEFSPCRVDELVTDAADYIESLVEDRQQQLDLQVAEGPVLNAHRDLLFQMLVNLLDNAVKYSPAGSRIRLAARADEQGWALEVSDHGSGIPESARQRIFERLYRLDSARNTEGLGLGLSLVKAIVELHHGSIEVLDNTPGTRVLVRLPLQNGSA